MQRQPAEGPLDFARRAGQQYPQRARDINNITTLYERQRYAPYPTHGNCNDCNAPCILYRVRDRCKDTSGVFDADILYSISYVPQLQTEYFPALGYFYIQYPGHTPIFRREKFFRNLLILLNKIAFKKHEKTKCAKTNKFTLENTPCDIPKMSYFPTQYPAWSCILLVHSKNHTVISG